MASSDVCPTEDALKAFLEYLVDPMLPAKPCTRDNVPPSQQQSVAKQVHSVVLLYNYYLRKQYPELASLPFHEFCKLAVVLRPALSAQMASTQKPEETELVNLEKQLSLTEEKIMDACNICICLDASKNVPDIEGWPISKVAVLLIDSKMENCFLLFSSITEGVWSVVEKDVNTFSRSSEVTSGASGAKYTYKKKRVIKKPTKYEFNSGEDEILQIGYSAVKEAAGINKTDIITILESHTVYSQSKPKTASRFYIMKCSPLIKQEIIQVPIKYLIESLQGPLVKRSSSSWIVTSVVEYFHVLPYSEIISQWISRETFSNSLQDSKPAVKNMMVGSPEVTEPYIRNERMSIDLNIKSSSDAIDALNQNKNNGSFEVTLSASAKEAQDVHVDNSLAFPSKNKECQHIVNTLHVREDQEIENPSVQNPTKVENGDSMRMPVTQVDTKDQSTCDKICAKTSSENDSREECVLIANNPNSDHQKLPVVTASNEKTMSQTAITCFKNDSIEECALIANNPNSDHEKLQVVIASNEKTLSQTAITSFKNDSIEERALIVNNPNLDLEKLKILVASKGKTLSQTAKTSSKNNSIGERALITNNPNSDLEKFQIVVASEEKTLSQTAITSFKNDSMEERILNAKNLNSDLENLQILIASKGKAMSQTALNNLMQKRNTLVLQQRMIEDEIALCDKKIQRILTSGEDDLELKLESIIEGCNDSWVRNQARMSQHLDDQALPPCGKRRRLKEAVFIMKSPCQELDDICRQNSWLLPIYRVSESNGEFQSNVAVKGVDFECSCGGKICSHPHEARESAAAEMLATLRRMAKSEQ